jgi:hypothetical protein
MNSSITVVLTDTAIALLSKNTVLTSIPLRRWTSSNGSTWSGRLRPHSEVTWLIDRLRTVLRNDGADSVMKRVSQVLSEEPPPPPTKEVKSDREPTSTPKKVKKVVVKTVRKQINKSTIGRYMPWVKPRAPRLRPVDSAVLAQVQSRGLNGAGVRSR